MLRKFQDLNDSAIGRGVATKCNKLTCCRNQPCRLDDFMNYLTYVERNSENLRFYLWFRKYIQRFDTLSESEKSLSPAWESTLQKAERSKAAALADEKRAVETDREFASKLDPT